jgi:hypothetical protein
MFNSALDCKFIYRGKNRIMSRQEGLISRTLQLRINWDIGVSINGLFHINYTISF